jgi:hypothetical protein
MLRQAKEYFKSNNIAPSLAAVVDKVLQEKPTHPVTYMAGILRTQGILETAGDVSLDADPRDVVHQRFRSATPEEKEYVEQYRIQSLCTDLLKQLKDERPEDPLEYCLTWLRWNRAHYNEPTESADAEPEK